MPSCVDFEVRPKSSITERALQYDVRVREIDRTVRESWSELAAICIQVRDKELWRMLPAKFHSFDDWLIDAAPCCRATVYKGMGVLSVIAKDLSPQEIAGIEIGNAILLSQVSSSVRRDPEVIQAAKSGRSSNKLREIVRTKYPNQHVEAIVEKKLHFTTSQWEKIEAAHEAYKLTDEMASLETFLEWCVSEAS